MICTLIYTVTPELKCIRYVDSYDINRYLEKFWKQLYIIFYKKVKLPFLVGKQLFKQFLVFTNVIL